MSPTLVPAVSARSTALRHVKRAESHTDIPIVVLAVICLVILTLTIVSIARYFCRERRRNSSSSTDPSGRSPSHWYSPRCLGSLRTGCTATPSHQDPFPALPPRDPVRPWPVTYRPTYPRVHHEHRPYSHRSHRFGEYRPSSLAVYRLSGLNAYQPSDHPPRRPPGFNAYTPGGLPLHRRPRPYNMKRSRLQRFVLLVRSNGRSGITEWVMETRQHLLLRRRVEEECEGSNWPDVTAVQHHIPDHASLTD
ncbi:hypothetical protein BKA82DRAFT_1005787, partial [Pisolithus tinctorius]